MQLNRKYKHFMGVLLVLPLLCIIAACRAPLPMTYKPSGTSNLEELTDLAAKTPSTYNPALPGAASSLRIQAIQDIALSLGAQSGLAWRSEEIDRNLEKHGTELDNVYNFHALLLPHSVLPPVLEEGRQTLNLSDPNTIRLSDRSYTIISQARFVTQPPNWRDYLWQSFTKPETPNFTLLPQTKKEKAVWIEYVGRGWKQGITQSDTIYTLNLARLTRDMNGMIIYRKLLAQGMVSPPFVATTKLGVTGTSDGTGLRINDQILRITALPNLQTDTSGWQPGVAKEVP
jgi:defect-in-organelle-trafficking protein DotC